MDFRQQLADVIGSLARQRTRTFLTLFGIILGVGTLVFLSSLLAGSEAYMAHGIQQASGDDIVTVSPKWGDPNPRAVHKLDRFDTRALAGNPGLAGGQVLNRYSTRVGFGHRRGQFVYVVGTLPEAVPAYGLAAAKGRFLAQGDVATLSSVAVLGAQVPQKLLPDEPEPLGKVITLQGQRYTVIGVLAPKASGGKGFSWTWDTSVVIPEPVFRARLYQNATVSEVVLKADTMSPTHPTTTTIAGIARAVLMGRHRVENFRVRDPAVESDSDRVVRYIVTFLEVSVAGVCLGVGGINLMNIMVVNVMQRRREIGVRRAVGATAGMIARQFVIEAVLLAAVGGLLGLLAGNLFAFAVARLLSYLWGFWPFVPMPLQMVLGFAAAVLTGLVFGWYPARQAAAMQVVDCLRAE